MPTPVQLTSLEFALIREADLATTILPEGTLALVVADDTYLTQANSIKIACGDKINPTQLATALATKQNVLTSKEAGNGIVITNNAGAVLITVDDTKFTTVQHVASAIATAITNYYTKLEIDTKLTNKVDVVAGKGLSTNDFTTAEKTKLTNIETGAQVNTVNTVAGRQGAIVLTKADVGLTNVDNTSDANKPISTAAKEALDLKAAITYVDEEISEALAGLGKYLFITDKPKFANLAALLASTDVFERGEVVFVTKSEEPNDVSLEYVSLVDKTGPLLTTEIELVGQTGIDISSFKVKTLTAASGAVTVANTEGAVTVDLSTETKTAVVKATTAIQQDTLDTALVTKQDVLTPGAGISIIENTIASTITQTVVTDSVTSTSSTAALSANQGKLLSDKVNTKTSITFISYL